MFPQLGGTWRQYRLRDLNEIAYERFGLWSKRQCEASIGAEEVSDDGISASLHTLEQQRRPAFVDHPTMDLRELEVRIDLGFDCDDFVFSC